METNLRQRDVIAEAENQLYYAQRRCSQQWRVFLAAFSSELFGNAQGDDAKDFLRDVGRTMAELFVLPQVQGLQDLEDAMNSVWEQTDWGWVRLSDGGNSIDICHYATPSVLVEDPRGLWARGLGYVLEGLYGHWFTTQGASPHLRTRLVPGAAPGDFHLRHGR